MSELLTGMFKFEQEVETVNGHKLLIANSAEELAEAVAAAQNEAKLVSPDINNPEHANLPATAFLEEAPAAESEVEPEIVAPPKRSHSRRVVE